MHASLVRLLSLLMAAGVSLAACASEADPERADILDDDRAADRGDDDGDQGATDADEPDASGDVVVPEGFEIVEGDGVSIALPEGWVPFDASQVEPDEFAEAFPDVPREIIEQAAEAFRQGAVLVAFGLAEDEFADNINILRIPTALPLGALEVQAQGQLESLGADVASVERTELPAGDALRVEYDLEVAGPGGSSIQVSGVQYYVSVGRSTFVITVSTGADAGQLAEIVADTFRVQ